MPIARVLLDDESLVEKVRQLGGFKTKRAAAEAAHDQYIRWRKLLAAPLPRKSSRRKRK